MKKVAGGLIPRHSTAFLVSSVAAAQKQKTIGRRRGSSTENPSVLRQLTDYACDDCGQQIALEQQTSPRWARPRVPDLPPGPPAQIAFCFWDPPQKATGLFAVKPRARRKVLHGSGVICAISFREVQRNKWTMNREIYKIFLG